MADKIDKTTFAIIVICIVAGLQALAWGLGINGAVFNFTSLIIGAIAGAILGFSYTAKASK